MENNKKRIKQRKREWSIDTTWIYLENIMLNEGSQSPKATIAWFYLTWNVLNNKSVQMESRSVMMKVGRGLSGSESSELRKMFLNSDDGCKLLWINWEPLNSIL